MPGFKKQPCLLKTVALQDGRSNVQRVVRECPLPKATPSPYILRVLPDVPSSLGDVEHHPIRASPFHLNVAWAAWGHGGVESVLLGEALPLDVLELLRCLCQIIHLKAKMVNAVVVGSIGTHVSI